MQLTSSSRRDGPSAAILLSLLAFTPLQADAMLQCNKIVANGARFNLEKLGGPHSVVTSKYIAPSYHNTTYTLDICQPLKRSSGVPKEEECPNGSRACAIRRIIGTDEKHSDVIDSVFPLAGDLKDQGMGDLDPETTRLKTSDSNEDSKKEGLRIILNGGRRVDPETSQKRQQRVIVEFLCDPDRDGTEGETKPEDQYERRSLPALAARDGEGEGEGDGGDEAPAKEIQLNGTNASLIFNSYGPLEGDSNIDVLRLTWYSKYACEDRAEGDDGEPKPAHWGFFTWLVILVFLGTAAYLIFGSWLNYHRYGARGWDLLPHGDTIRDIPYLLKDWTRRVLNTVQGSGSRGGYSAV